MSEPSDAHFRALFEQTPISMLVYDRDGRPLRVNAAFTALWGLTLADLVGYRILDDPQLVAAGVIPLGERAFAGAPTWQSRAGGCERENKLAHFVNHIAKQGERQKVPERHQPNIDVMLVVHQLAE